MSSLVSPRLLLAREILTPLGDFFFPLLGFGFGGRSGLGALRSEEREVWWIGDLGTRG